MAKKKIRTKPKPAVQMIRLEVGPTLERLRRQAGLTQEELAKKLGLKDKSSISNIESGKTSLSINRLEMVAHALGQEPVVVLMTVLRDQYPEFTAGPYGKIVEELSQHVSTEIDLEGS